MKKIDFHMHTVATSSDSAFEFSMTQLLKYVTAAQLDAIAITNHNLFDPTQYSEITHELPIEVFPGIEVDVDSCHILVIAAPANVASFIAAAELVAGEFSSGVKYISLHRFKEIFGNLDDYLVIPHYQKKPEIKDVTLAELSTTATCGEVNSAKKFIRCIKDGSQLVPVLFSDSRISTELKVFSTRHTYIDCGELTLDAVKACLSDRNKVSLSMEDGNSLFQVLSGGLKISTGLNVLVGARSSGKSYALDQISTEQKRTKYIRQFSLVQTDEEKYRKEFESEIDKQQKRCADEHLTGLRSMVNDVIDIDLVSLENGAEQYVETLVKSAEEADRNDSFSSASLFSESSFSVVDESALKDLIASTRHLIENIDYRSIIDKHVNRLSLKRLSCELIELLWRESEQKSRQEIVNALVSNVKSELSVRSSATQIFDVDLYEVALAKRKIDKFSEVVKHVRKKCVIQETDVQGYRIIVRKEPFQGAQELKNISQRKVAFSDAMNLYDKPFDFLLELRKIEGLPDADLYRFFVKIVYSIENSDGYPVSGGERSEFRLLQNISDAQNYDFLLIDEPESSFDNLFLKGNVNELIRDIAKNMPVVVVTHNSTVGATIGADYILMASKEKTNSGFDYKIYSGHPTDKVLKCADSTEKISHVVMMDTLEAGHDTYEARRAGYEAIKD